MRDLRHLRYFVAVAEEGHFGRAAARLHVSAPTLSQQIKSLERELGTLLLVRSSRGAALTPEGDVLYRHAKQMLAAAEQAVAETRSASGSLAGTLRVSVEIDAHDHVHGVVQAFAVRHPDVDLRYEVVEEPDVRKRLLDDGGDLAVSWMPVVDAGTQWKAIGQDRIVVAVRDDHPLAATGSVTPDDLQPFPFALFPREQSPEFFDWVSRDVLARGEDAPHVPVEARLGAQVTHVRYLASADGHPFTVCSQHFLSRLPDGIAVVALEPPVHVPLHGSWRSGARDEPSPTSRALDRLLSEFDGEAELA